MKKSIYILAVISMIIGGCDKIDEPYLEPIGTGGENEVTITVEFLDDIPGSFDLNVFIMEDGIIAPQKNDEASVGPTPDWLNYEHNHMLRASLTSTWGVDLADDPANGTMITKEFSFAIDAGWDMQNLSFLVFITDGNTFEVLQASEQNLSDPMVHTHEKVVLLEEFTGHLCVNCPEATKLAHELKEAYGEQLVLLSIHAGALAEPGGTPYDTDFQTSAGTGIYNQFSPVGVPTGMVNRTEYQGGVVLFKDSWESAIQELIGKPQQASIEISVTLAE